jgi:hypothetical protein
MASTRAAYRNSCVSASGKVPSTGIPTRLGVSKDRALKLAIFLARRAGMVLTWPNIQTIRVAIESEAQYSGVPLTEAANVILAAAREPSLLDAYSCPPEWQRFECYRENTVNRFWFEDARWRYKKVYAEFQLSLREGGQEAG